MRPAQGLCCQTAGTLSLLPRRRSSVLRLSSRTPKYRMARVLPNTSAQALGHTAQQVFEGSTFQACPAAADVLTLYTHTLCPYAQRSYLTLLCKGVPHRTIHIDLASKPSWYSAVNSRGLVPTVEYQGQVYLESIDICRWIDASFDGPDLKSDEPKTQKLVSNCAAFASAGLELLAGTTGRSWGIGSGQTQAQQKAFSRQLDAFSAQLQWSAGPYLLGKDVSLADLIYMPFMERFALALPEFTSYDVRGACGGSIGRWLDAMQELHCCQVAAAEPQLLLQALRKHQSLDWFDFVSCRAAQLHPHLQAAAGSDTAVSC